MILFGDTFVCTYTFVNIKHPIEKPTDKQDFGTNIHFSADATNFMGILSSFFTWMVFLFYGECVHTDAYFTLGGFFLSYCAIVCVCTICLSRISNVLMSVRFNKNAVESIHNTRFSMEWHEIDDEWCFFENERKKKRTRRTHKTDTIK